MAPRAPRRLVLALLVATSAVGVLGCGDDDEDEALTHQELISQADEICQKAEEEQDANAFVENLDNRAVLLRLSRVNRRAIEKLGELEPPGDDREEFDAVVAALERGTDAFEARAEGLKTKDSAAQSDASVEAEAAFGDMAAAAGPLGITHCQSLIA